MEIQLRGQYTQQDLRHALSLNYGHMLKIIGIVLGAIALLPLLIFAFTAISLSLEPSAFLGSIPPYLVWPALLIGFTFASPLIQARRMAKSPGCQGILTGVADDQVLALQNDLVASRVQWSAFIRYKMSDGVVLLYQTDAAMSIVPKSFFESDADWQRFRQHIQATVPEKAPKRSSVVQWILVAVIVLIFFAIFVGPILATVLPVLLR
jgi:hypothetical protein